MWFRVRSMLLNTWIPLHSLLGKLQNDPLPGQSSRAAAHAVSRASTARTRSGGHGASVSHAPQGPWRPRVQVLYVVHYKAGLGF